MPNSKSTHWVYLSISCISMALVVFISNKLVEIPIRWLEPNWFNYAQFTFPLTFLITDLINRLLGSSRAYVVIAVGFVVGGIMSMTVGDFRIGLASMSAFAIGQLMDVGIFNRLRDFSWWLAPLTSSLLASLVDTAWFYTVAFAGADWPWHQQAVVDFGVKMLVAFIALIPFRLIAARMLMEKSALH